MVEENSGWDIKKCMDLTTESHKEGNVVAEEMFKALAKLRNMLIKEGKSIDYANNTVLQASIGLFTNVFARIIKEFKDRSGESHTDDDHQNLIDEINRKVIDGSRAVAENHLKNDVLIYERDLTQEIKNKKKEKDE
jgi:hypothetical protein